MFLYINADKRQTIEFYDFLQVNTESNGSEVIDNARSRDDEEVNQLEAAADKEQQQSKAAGVPFIDFLAVNGS